LLSKSYWLIAELFGIAGRAMCQILVIYRGKNKVNFFFRKEIGLKVNLGYAVVMSTDCFRLNVKFTGRVQGVGFRWNVKDVSTGNSVTGYVKNLSDGSVEMLAEGEEEEVLSFLVAVEERMLGFVTERSQVARKGERQFPDFKITY